MTSLRVVRSFVRVFHTHSAKLPCRPSHTSSPSHSSTHEISSKECFLSTHPPLTSPSLAPFPRSDFSPFLHFPKTCSIIGAPLASGQPLVGVDLGPAVLRAGGLIERLESDDWRVHDYGDIWFNHDKEPTRSVNHKSSTNSNEHSENNGYSHLLHSSTVAAANAHIAAATEAAAKKHEFVLTLGGDHSIGIGSMSGLLAARPDMGILWVDAHADINTPRLSLSGNIHGMVVSFLMNLENCRNEIRGFEWMNELPELTPSRIVYVALRDIDLAEKNILKQLGIRCYTMYEIDRYGMSKVMEMSFDSLIGRRQLPLHLSFDIDSVDPLFAPSTGTRVAGGLSYREAYYICESVAETNLLSSMDLVEVNPSLGSGVEGASEKTVNMAVGLISSAMGNKIL